MSMIGMFRRVSSRVVDDLRANPERIQQVLYPNTMETAIDDDVRIDVDEAWHGLHFLLTGQAHGGKPPLDFILDGGQQVGDIDVGYGPARSFTPAEVRKIATALALIRKDTLCSRFDPEALTKYDVYPLIWEGPSPKGDPLAYLLEHFDNLKDFITTTAQAEAGMIVYLM